MRRGRRRCAGEVAARAEVASAVRAPRSSRPGRSDTGRSLGERTGLLAGRSSRRRWLVSVASSFSRRPPLNDQPAFWRAGLHQTTPSRTNPPQFAAVLRMVKRPAKSAFLWRRCQLLQRLLKTLHRQDLEVARMPACLGRVLARRHDEDIHIRLACADRLLLEAAHGHTVPSSASSPVAAIRQPRVMSRPS